jgi:hypothetical protein
VSDLDRITDAAAYSRRLGRPADGARVGAADAARVPEPRDLDELLS